MKKMHILVLISSLVFTLMLTACDDGSFEDEYYEADSQLEDGGEYDNDSAYSGEDEYDEEAPLTADDCYEDETYDPETQSCLFNDADSYTDETYALTADDCYEDEIYDPETQSCLLDIDCAGDAECELILAEYYGESELGEYEFFAESAEECLPGESYDASRQVCYLECDSVAECDQLAEKIYDGLDVYFNDSYDGGSEPPSSKTPTETADNTNIPDDLSGGDPELPTIARYLLNNNLDLQLAGIDDSQPDSQINQARHQEIWDFLRRILPPTLLISDVSEYHIFTDGVEETLAYVSPLSDDATQWLIGIDIADAGTSGKINTRDFVHTTIHEYAHILTLENDQVPPDTSLSAEEIEDGVESDVAQACTTYYTGEGCALSNSYINQYFTKFWADLYYNEFQDVEWAETDEEYEEKLIEFYDAHADQFVTDYAATNPGEDIAESFTYFVLQDKPNGNSIDDQKIRFFYDYPSLVAIHTHIRGELARML